MDEKRTISKDNDWLRCESKMQPGKQYLFNKCTGETRWCTELSGKQKSKTPAQDRLKRLQKSLEKNKHKDSAVMKAKDVLKNKQIILSGKVVSPPPKSEKNPLVIEPCLLANKNKVISETSTSKPTKELNNSSQRSLDKNSHIPPEKTNDAASAMVRVAKKKNKKRKRNNASNRPSSDSNNQQLNKCSNVIDLTKEQINECSNVIDLTKEISNISSPKKARISGKLHPMEGDVFPGHEQKMQCDPIDIDEVSREKKTGLMSAVKGYCTNLLNKVINPNKANKSKAKTKKTALNGSSQENQNQKLPSTQLANTLSKSCSKGRANDRLRMLRISLQEQQALINGGTQQIMPLPFNSCSSQNTSHMEIEAMDWQPICDDTSLTDTNFSNMFSCSEHYEIVNENLLRLVADRTQCENNWKTNHYYFVVDTNVFIENISFLDELTTMKLCDTAGTVIFIPYCVLQELDKLKVRSPSESIKMRSIRAIHFINKAFVNKLDYIQAQSSTDENKHLIKVTSPDDSILNCCLQVKEHIENMMLLTEDINFRNKALCSDILVSTKSDLISKHESLL